MVRHLKGKLFGDKGYISAALVEELARQGLDFITTLKKNMKKKIFPLLTAFCSARDLLSELPMTCSKIFSD